MALTGRQKTELNKSIYGYLKSNGFGDIADIFADECGTDKKDEEKFKTHLERKWRSIIRLKTKIQELKDENESLEDELEKYASGDKVDDSESLPKKVKKKWDVHQEMVNYVKFNPTKPILASCSDDKEVKLFNWQGMNLEQTLDASKGGHKDAVQNVCWSPAGDMLATSSADTTIMLWALNKDEVWTKKMTLTGHEHTVSGLVFNKEATFLYSASRDKTIKKWEVSSGRCKKSYNNDEEGHDDWIKEIQLSPNGDQIASAGLDMVICLWNESTGKLDNEPYRDHENAIEALAYSSIKADKNIIDSVLEDEDKKIAESKKKQLAESKDGDQGGMFLLSGSRDRTMRLWFIQEGVCVRVIKGHDNWIRGCLFHPSGTFIVSCSDDKSVRVWDLTKNCYQILKHTFHKSFVQCIDYNKSCPLMVTGGVECEVFLWDCR